MIQPYRGYANEERIYLRGRVLENEGIIAEEAQSRWHNLKDSFHRMESDEVANATIQVTVAGNEFTVKSGPEGYFTIDEPWQAPPKSINNRWLNAKVELIEAPNRSDTYETTAEIYFPSKNADYGLITDMDDTVLQTYVTSRLKWKMVYATFFKNAFHRLPMEGIVELFQAFEKGGNGLRQNPVFYLSNSPTNIYDLLEDFLNLNQLPKGPVLLRDYGWHLLRKKPDELNHKIKTMRHILNMYPKLPFILLGDTASEDADYYIQIAKEFPNRIKAIYIRYTRDTKNARRVAKIIGEETDVTVALIKQTTEIWEHARLTKLLTTSDLKDLPEETVI